MSDRPTPETDDLARGNHVVPTEWAQQLERERDEAMAQNAKLREIGERAIDYLNQSYRNGFEDEANELRAELEQIKEGAK